MSSKDFPQVVDQIVRDDPRYERGAYLFVRRALDHTVKGLGGARRERGGAIHVSGPQLLEGIRELALDQYGPLAWTVIDSWGIRSCRDFGEIVFNLVEYGVFGRTEHDRREDFSPGYSLEEAFLAPFRPKSGPPTLPPLSPEP